MAIHLKNKILNPIILFLITTVLLISCGSKPVDEETQSEIEEPEVPEEVAEYSFEEDYFADVVWQDIKSLKELYGHWNTPDGIIDFPYWAMDNKEFLSITEYETDDTEKWQAFAREKRISLDELWNNRYLYIPEIYNTDYPIADANGDQFGIKIERTDYEIIGKTIITSRRQLLVPVETVNQNLNFFKISEDGEKLYGEGTFRFFSKTFVNLHDSFKLEAPSSSQRTAPKYGLVLSGGGGKGAYEVGVWKAFYEFGLAQKIRVVSGTSVGGLNSALFAIQPYENIENIWVSKVPDKLTQNDALISQEGLSEIISSIPLVKLQMLKFPQVYVTAVRNKFLLAKLVKSKPEQYATRFNLNEETSISQTKKKLLATSAFPIICPSVKLADGFEYSDGGNEAVGGDNTPIRPITENHPEVDKIFIVYLQHEPKRKIKEIDFDTKQLVHFIPSIELGGILDGTANFTSNRIKLLIKYGYEDAISVLNQNGYYPVSEMWFKEEAPLSTEDILALYSEEQ